jgi:glycosidase
MGLFEIARMPMKWGDEQDGELLAFFRRLIDLRRGHAVLPQGMRRVLHLDAEAGTYAYLRAAQPDGYTAGDVLAAFNLSTEPRSLHIPLAASPAVADKLGHQVVRPLGNGLEVRLAPLSGAFIA